jgi:hypothetical protein
MCRETTSTLRAQPTDGDPGMTLEEYLASRIPWPDERPALRLEDMDAAIAQTALGSADRSNEK